MSVEGLFAHTNVVRVEILGEVGQACPRPGSGSQGQFLARMIYQHDEMVPYKIKKSILKISLRSSGVRSRLSQTISRIRWLLNRFEVGPLG